MNLNQIQKNKRFYKERLKDKNNTELAIELIQMKIRTLEKEEKTLRG